MNPTRTDRVARPADPVIPRVSVTGASGFIGSALCLGLRQQGWRVRGLTRSDAAAERLSGLGVEVVRGGLADGVALADWVAGADAVVHCAGAVRGADYDDFARTNVNGTRRLLEAMAGLHLPLVALSSLAAREPALSDYARSKYDMERLLEASGVPNGCLMLRPPAVYGPGDRELRPLFDAFARGIAPLPGAPEARVSLLHVDDLVAAIVAWLDASDRPDGVYEIGDQQAGGYSWEEVVATAETLLQRRIRRIRLPRTALAGAARANRRLARWFGYAPMLTPGKLAELRHDDWVCDNTPLQDRLDWQPQVTLAEGLARTCGWGA
ncbi:NAD(P)-dependent oxidoreductase [Salinisphaera sp. T31B1]|uniref:NAD-dependent epimerase/dehydratase family protein n=1 Tax=Salinisphaera sp. T31B1 TaxID=727963 RepID=UPI0033409C16